MKAVFTVMIALITGLLSPAQAQEKRIELEVIDRSNSANRGTSSLEFWSDSTTAAKMHDPAYQRNLSGTYQISYLTPDFTLVQAGSAIIRADSSGRMMLSLPEVGEHELIAMIPIFFRLKDLPTIEVLVFTTNTGEVFAFDIIDKSKPENTPEHRRAARKIR